MASTLEPTTSTSPTLTATKDDLLSDNVTIYYYIIGGIIFVLLVCMISLIFLLRKTKNKPLAEKPSNNEHTLIETHIQTPTSKSGQKTDESSVADLFRINSTSNVSMVITDDIEDETSTVKIKVTSMTEDLKEEREQNVFGIQQNTSMFGSVKPANNSKLFTAPPIPKDSQEFEEEYEDDQEYEYYYEEEEEIDENTVNTDVKNKKRRKKRTKKRLNVKTQVSMFNAPRVSAIVAQDIKNMQQSEQMK